MTTGTSDALTVVGTLIDTGALTISAGSFVVQNGGQGTIVVASSNGGAFDLANNSSVSVNGNFTNSAPLNVDKDIPLAAVARFFPESVL